MKRRRLVGAFGTYLRIFAFTLFILLMLRVIVLTSEAYAMISSSRSSNSDFLQLCEDGIATNSPHMRNACTQARVEHAPPAILRALTSAVFAFCGELYSLALAPLQAISLAGILSIVSALPWLSTLRTAIGWGANANAQSLGGYEVGIGMNGSLFPSHRVYMEGDPNDFESSSSTSNKLTHRNGHSLRMASYLGEEGCDLLEE